jgi:DNA replication and repair protein RecF
MRLNSLSILNYKNIAEAELHFSPKINCFIGNNGMGKTNILDAIYYLSFCKSHSNSIDSQNIMHQAEFCLIQGKYLIGDSAEDIYCGMKLRQKKQFKRNKKEYERLSDHIGLLPLVLVSPDDSVLISEGSEERRKFIDGVISQYNKNYLNQLFVEWTLMCSKIYWTKKQTIKKLQRVFF